MSGSIVILDTSIIHPGKIAQLRSAMAELAAFVEANEPRAIAYDVYVDSTDSTVTVLQVHPDSASAEFHMDVAAELFARFKDLLRLQTIDVYGDASEGLLARLQRKSELLGGTRLVVHPLHVGFVRSTTAVLRDR